MAELGCQLEDMRTVLDLMTDVEPDDAVAAKQLHAGSLTLFRLVCNALETLDGREVQA